MTNRRALWYIAAALAALILVMRLTTPPGGYAAGPPPCTTWTITATATARHTTYQLTTATLCNHGRTLTLTGHRKDTRP